MNYVEWLRVRNALRIYAIVLGILIVIGLIVRVSLAPQLNHDQYLIDRVSREPGTKISHSVVERRQSDHDRERERQHDDYDRRKAGRGPHHPHRPACELSFKLDPCERCRKHQCQRLGIQWNRND